MIAHITSVLVQLITSYGYVAVFIFMFLESLLIPIPSEVTMPFAGFLAQQGHVNFWLVVFIGAIANLVGSWVAYAIGYYLEEHIIVSFIKRYGKFILVTEHEYEKSMHWFQKYGMSVVFFSRLLPAVRTFISLPAGLAEMNLAKFSVYTFVGSFLWSLALTYVGFYLGSKWESIHPIFQKLQIGIVALIIIAILWYINHKLKIISFKKKS